MIFEKIYTVPTAEELLDKAFRRANRARKGKTVKSESSRRRADESMLLTATNILSDNLANVVRQFPSFDNIPEFYRELADILVGVNVLKTNIASVQWAGEKIHEVGRLSVGKMRHSSDSSTIRKAAYGRMSSIVNDVDKNLRLLNDARNILRKLPAVGMEPTIVIAGYPNVGKSSFVALVSSATPEVASYPFTTKGLAVGHFKVGNVRCQIVDTPGLLDRPLSERNEIELQAISALKHLGDVLLFIVDPSGTCGYEPEDQVRLLEEVRGHIEMPVLVAANKADLLEEAPGSGFDAVMSTLTGEGVDDVMKRLISMIDIEKYDPELYEEENS
ncbi:MAG: NOG1 family protein [ANME-2 cluster archaeon]|nr:NOG1 family protein [ANME-2 cluster archaeon]